MASKRGVKKLIQQNAILKGIPLRDAQKEIRVEWKRKAFLQIKSFSLEEAFFKSCIYYLMAGENIVYVGETESLMTRIGQHVRENVKVFDGIRFVWFAGTREERLQKEKDEIKFHKPHYNVMHNEWKYVPSKEAKQKFKEKTSHKRLRGILDKISPQKYDQKF